jgi:hypothetical protein
MQTLPTFQSYGQYSSDNYGVNCLVFTDAQRNDYYFSYETLVAFWTAQTGLVVRENDWGPTTGKHLNWIESDKSKRISGEEFEKKCQEVFKKS